MIRKLIAVFALTALCVAPVMADRLKDLAKVKGVRNNQLIGYGWWSVLTVPATKRRLPTRPSAT